jgi:hypothetical protein
MHIRSTSRLSRRATLAPILLTALAGCGASPEPSSEVLSPQALTAALPDMVITAVAYDGDRGTFASIVKNVGQVGNPLRTDVGVAYLVDGIPRTWGSTHASLGPLRIALIGTGGGTFQIPAGAHTITAWVDDVDRFAEGNEANNRLSQTITVDGPTVPPSTPAGTFLWRDAIQTAASPWGFDGIAVEHPIGLAVVPLDGNGVNLSRVANPLAGGGFALRHFATFDDGGARAQAGIYSFASPAFSAQAKSAEGVWVAQEWYFPTALTARGDDAAWLNLWDWHSTDTGGANRWHTAPGLMLAEDGSMRVRWEWGGPAGAFNPRSGTSAVALPVGRWFEVEMHYTWTTGWTTISLWIDGALALEQAGVQTRAPSHGTIETYMKFYGGTAWTPTQAVKYTRNVRVAAARIGGR